MSKTVEKILNNAFITIERSIKYAIENQNDRDFAKKYMNDSIDDLKGYIATLYRFGTMKEKEFDECAYMIRGFKFYLMYEYLIG